MIISSHLCLLTDGSFAHFPIAEIDEHGVVVSLRLCPEGLEEIGGMTFVGGVMLCGVPSNVSGVTCSCRDDFARQMAAYGVHPGHGPVCIMRGADLNTFCGSFVKQSKF